MREVSNCLNAILVLLTLPICVLSLIAALAGTVIGAFAPTWLPDWLQFITSKAFLFIAPGLITWYSVANIIAGSRMSNTMDFCGIEAAFGMFEDGLSGYLLVAGAVLKGLM
jgi:integral membrane sensor domain MASE1